MVNLHPVDWTVIGLYFLAMAFLGFKLSKRNRDTEQYFVGGRKFAGWVLGLSLVGTSISSVSFLAYPADAYRTAWIRMIPNFAMPLAACVAVLVFIPFYRSAKYTSAYEYLGLRYGTAIRVYGSCMYILSQFIRLGIVLFLIGKLLETLTAAPIAVCIVVAGIVVALYTVLGGFEAVVWTDVIQTLVLLVGGIAMFATIVARVPGGLGEVFSTATAAGKLSFSQLTDGQLVPIGWGWTLSEKTGLMMLLLGITMWMQEFAADQNVVQRYCSAASEREATKALWWSVLLRIPIWAFFMFLGTALYVFYQVHPDPRSAAMLSGTEQPEGIVPWFLAQQIPIGMAGLVIAAAVAAAMSSLDSSMNAISAVLVTDLYRTHIRPGRTECHYLRAARGISAFAALAMVALALVVAVSETKTIQDTVTTLGSIFGGGLLGLFVFGFFTPWGDGRAAGCGIAATLTYTLYVVASEQGFSNTPPFDLYYATIIGNLLMVAVMGVASAIWRRSPMHSLENLTVWTGLRARKR